MKRLNAYLDQACNSIMLVHLFSFIHRNYKEQMFIIFYKQLVINVVNTVVLIVESNIQNN